jgi:tetratricopeptide (TPR) repeat protein
MRFANLGVSILRKEVGNRAGKGQAYEYLGIAFWEQGDFSKAIVYHAQHLAIAQEVGNRWRRWCCCVTRAGEAEAYTNLGNAFQSLGNYAKAIKYHGQCLAITKVS